MVVLNPILFDKFQYDAGFDPYSKNLSEYACDNRLVGVTDDGVLIVDDKVAHCGYYEFFPKLVPWGEISSVRIAPCIGWGGVAFGLACLAMAYCAFCAVWRPTLVGREHEYKMLLVGGISAVVTLVGARRNCIQVIARGKKFRWISMPLLYTQSLERCFKFAVYCRKHEIRYETHVHGDSRDRRAETKRLETFVSGTRSDR